MKKLLTIIFVSTILMSFSYGQIKVGGALNYASEIENLGISIDGVYKIDNQWEVAADFIYYLEKDDILSWKALDINAHYIFSKKNDMMFYALGGINFLMWDLDMGSFSSDGTDTNFNLGAGTRKALGDNMFLFGELKYVLGDGDHLNFKAGLMFALN